MRIQRDKGFSFYNLYEGSSQYHELDLHEISSGEMHQVVLYYDFLFNCDPGTVVLIDEPEISLHVYAQSLFIENLRRIADKNMNNLQFIVATHSPTIIGEHWDMTYDLLTGAYNE
jgi:predicted ATP-binding protein involved in virulence